MNHVLKKIYLGVCCLVFATASASEVIPPTRSDDQRLELTALAKGTEPFTYQWYRGTDTNPLATKIPAPEGVQQTLTLQPPFVAGLITCVVTNSAGSCTTRSTRISITKVTSAADMQFTVKQP